MRGCGIPTCQPQEKEKGPSDFSATSRDIDFRKAGHGIPAARMKFVPVTVYLQDFHFMACLCRGPLPSVFRFFFSPSVSLFISPLATCPLLPCCSCFCCFLPSFFPFCCSLPTFSFFRSFFLVFFYSCCFPPLSSFFPRFPFFLLPFHRSLSSSPGKGKLHWFARGIVPRQFPPDRSKRVCKVKQTIPRSQRARVRIPRADRRDRGGSGGGSCLAKGIPGRRRSGPAPNQ